MWPWEHLVVGYLLYSGSTRLRKRGAPSDGPALAVALGTQFPDIVDKPLAWIVLVLPQGVLAHSLFVALGVVGVVAAVARRVGRPELAVAFGVGYLSHLPADGIYPVLLGRAPAMGFMLWPLVPHRANPRPGFVANFVRYFDQYATYIASPRGLTYLVIEVSLLAAGFLVWTRDGYPGVAAVRRLGSSVRNRVGVA